MSERRTVVLTPASAIEVRPVHWLWADRLALGVLALLGGREGIGKSILGYTLAADVTRGRLPGVYFGIPKAVIVAATEDSWAHTIVPRLMAAGADLDRVFRVDVTTAGGVDTSVSLPRDLLDLERMCREHDVALILLDPLVSRLNAELDTHKDAEVRLALEPVAALADRARALVLGLIHVNKSASRDPLTMLMGSRAFAAVARAVLFMMVDPDNDRIALVGQPKNNLGLADPHLPTLTCSITSAHVADTDEGPVFAGQLHWVGESMASIREAIEATGDMDRTAVAEATEWLSDYLEGQGGEAESADAKAEGKKAGHSTDALKRARQKLRVTSASYGFPRRTKWSLSPSSGSNVRESHSTAPTAPTVGRVITTTTTTTTPTDGPSGRSQRSGRSRSNPQESAPTGRIDLADRFNDIIDGVGS